MAEIVAVEETFKRLQSHKGVVGVLVVNGDGIAVRSTLDSDASVAYAALVSQFVTKARCAVRGLAADDELRFVRLRSRKHEVLVAPHFERGHEYALVVVQEPSTD